ncbi:hypothetical protein [Actinocrispum wychmicini]|uniref:PPE family protein n=1 Tax=Actinocrispum wychmicini TaxID=1213861 RepID=A0A4R2JGB1_9PSEU|nr:hypothetical protein [Actinocrispum wychmicini]TCO58054.1 hypothetical protein EV192_105117 [Actinocrispum wychmicini]
MVDGPKVPKADTHYMGVDHRELKAWTDAGQPGDANDLSDVWKSMGNGLNDAAEKLMVAVFGSESGWTGAAANAMRAQLQKVAEWSEQTGDSFTKASQAFVKQGESVGAAKSAMPEPVDYDPTKMIRDAALSANPVQIAMLPYDMHKQHQASQEAHQRAADVVQKRDTELAAAAQSIPPFEPPPALGGEGAKKPDQHGPSVPGGPGLPGGQPRVGGGGNGGGGRPGGGRGGGPGTGGPGGRPAGGAGPGMGAQPDDRDNNNPPPPSFGMPSLPMGTGTSGFAPSGSPPTSGIGPGGGPGFGGAAAAGGGGGFGGGFGGSAFGSPGAGFGPTGAGAGAGAGTPPGPGGARGAAGGRGGGAGGMGAGGHKGEGGEDEQHQRPSYLVEPDPDAMFGTDQMTAPPVIGG